MAKPPGGVTAGLYKFDLTGTENTPVYMYVILRVPFQPPLYHTQNKDYDLYKIGVSFERKITDSGEDIHATMWAGNATPTMSKQDLTDSASPAWKELGGGKYFWAHGDGQTNPDYPYGYPFHNWDVGSQADRYRFLLIEFELQSESAVDSGDVLDVHAVHVEMPNDDQEVLEKSTGELLGDGYAYCNRESGSIFHAADESVSAWDIMWCLCDTYEVFTSENKPSFSVPIIGSLPLPPV
jgi:hypothetical protein